MAHGGNVITEDAEAVNVAPVLCSSEPARHCELNTYFKSAAFGSYNFKIFFYGVHPELLFNQFIRIIYTTNCLRLKVRCNK